MSIGIIADGAEGMGGNAGSSGGVVVGAAGMGGSRMSRINRMIPYRFAVMDRFLLGIYRMRNILYSWHFSSSRVRTGRF